MWLYSAWIHKWMEHYSLRLHRPSKIHNCCEAEPWHFLSTCLCFSLHSVPHKRALFPARIRVTQTRVTRNFNAQNGCNICVTPFFWGGVNVLKKRSTAFCVYAGKKNVINSPDLDTSAAVIHWRSRTLALSKFAHWRLLKKEYPNQLQFVLWHDKRGITAQQLNIIPPMTLTSSHRLLLNETSPLLQLRLGFD